MAWGRRMTGLRSSSPGQLQKQQKKNASRQPPSSTRAESHCPAFERRVEQEADQNSQECPAYTRTVSMIDPMIRFEDILDKVESYKPDFDEELLQKAYIFSAREHRGQVRSSGEPYLVHPLQVAYILAEMRLDETSIAVGLLHVVLVKLADRLHNMRTLQFLAEEKRVAIAKETMEIYAPIAKRLGMGRLKSELEDLSFHYLHPKESE